MNKYINITTTITTEHRSWFILSGIYSNKSHLRPAIRMNQIVKFTLLLYPKGIQATMN